MIRAGGGVLANFSHGMADPFSYANADRDIEQVFFFLSVCAFYLQSDLSSFVVPTFLRWISSFYPKLQLFIFPT